MVLSGLGFIALIYVYFSFFLGPLNKSRASMEKSINDLQTKLGTSKSEMTKATNLERQAADRDDAFCRTENLSPEGAPIAWFPPRMKLFFANQQIDKATARLDGNAALQRSRARRMDALLLDDRSAADRFHHRRAKPSPISRTPNRSWPFRESALKAGTDDPQFQQVALAANTAIMKR